MSDDVDDLALLRRYAESGCEEAFAALVARHIHYVYSVARRECASAHQAEEVTRPHKWYRNEGIRCVEPQRRRGAEKPGFAGSNLIDPSP